ncbi:penicillin-binding transpeptidase domain-containing protein, partial [Staphylococcus aureus]
QSSSVVSNAGGGTCGGGDTVTIATALRLSCNIPMAELAVELGDDAIRAEAEKYGFNSSFSLVPDSTTFASTPSSYPANLD